MSNLSFNGVYRFDANQNLPTRKEWAQRDALMGIFGRFSANGEEEMAKFFEFDRNVKQGLISPKAPCYLTYNLQEESACQAFEKHMTDVGQKFERIG